MDAIEQANSGHPGTPTGMAPVAYTLWQRHLRFDPANPIWLNRDRFVLSAGHASMLLYSMLFLTGVKSVDSDYEIPGTPSVTLDGIKHFRQPESKCPGHPEYHLTSGVETTTGPLGSGVATSVGMAIAGRWLAERYNRPGDPNEVVEAWRVIMQLKHHPTMLVLSRQAQPTLDRTGYAPATGVAKGAYILADAADGKPEALLIATGTEQALAVSAYEQLTAEGIKTRVGSMPSWELFEQQDQAYRDAVLPSDVTARVAIEQGSTFGWAQWVGMRGAVLGMKTFGASAPLKALLHKFGFTVDGVVASAIEQLARVG